MMLQIRTLGTPRILLGAEQIGADQPMAFALLFFLALRGTPMPRRELARTLWPDAPDPERNHRLRSLLHRLRKQGAPVISSASTIAVGECWIDFRQLVRPPTSLDAIRSRLPEIGPVLPHLSGAPPTLADRLDDARDVVVATVTRWLLAALDLAKGAGDWPLAERVAAIAIAVDPAGDVGWLSLAEAQCLTGDRDGSLTTIDDFVARLGDDDEAIRQTARALRRRIVESGARQGGETGERRPRLFGRDDVMRRIWSAVARCRGGQGASALLWGPAGIGKTRVLDELSHLRLTDPLRIVRLGARPLHALRPMAIVAELAGRLLGEAGAAGCDPRAYATLRCCASPNDGRSAIADDALFDALVELLAAVSEEAPIVLAIDDLHLVDHAFWRFARAVVRWSADRPILWLFGYRAVRDGELALLPEQSVIQRIPLGCLERGAALELVESQARATVDPSRLFDRVGGHPLLLEAVSYSDGELPANVEWVVEDMIARLTPRAFRILRLLATLGGSATPRSLASVASFDRAELGAALGELEHTGMIHEDDGVLRAHAIWCDAALATLARSERLAINLD